MSTRRIDEGKPMSTPSRRFLISRFPCLLVSLLLLAVGCDLPGRPDPAQRPKPEDQVSDFAELFGKNCAGCHGAQGQLGPAPPLNDRIFRVIAPEQELESVIAKGRAGTLMPAFAKENGGTLTAAQIQVLVNEIKGFPYRVLEKREGNEVKLEIVREATGILPKWGPAGQAFAMPPPSYLAPADKPGGAGRLKQGAEVFARACATCHGSDGQGIEQQDRPRLKINDGAFLALISDQALRRFVITGRPDLGMPRYDESIGRAPDFEPPLTAQETADVVELLASWRQGGSGNGQ